MDGKHEERESKNAFIIILTHLFLKVDSDTTFIQIPSYVPGIFNTHPGQRFIFTIAIMMVGFPYEKSFTHFK